MKAIVTVIGKDRVGIIALVSQLLAERGVNVLDISQTVLQDYFTMIMLVDASQCTEPFANLAGELAGEGVQDPQPQLVIRQGVPRFFYCFTQI